MVSEMTYEAAKKIAEEIMEIKGHECMFCETNTFGYSVLVFKDHKHIHFADDYQIHHEHLFRKGGKAAVRDFYIREMNARLFTDEELIEDVHSYDELKRKENFLRNFWIMRYDHESIFGSNGIDKDCLPYYNPVSFCYVSDSNIVEQAVGMLQHLKKCFALLQQDDDTFAEMIRHELENHEACVTCSATEALEALGLTFETLSVNQKQIVEKELRQQISRRDY